MGDIAEALIDNEMFGGHFSGPRRKRSQRKFIWWQDGKGSPRIKVAEMSIEQLEKALAKIEEKQYKLTWKTPLAQQLRYLKRKEFRVNG